MRSSTDIRLSFETFQACIWPQVHEYLGHSISVEGVAGKDDRIAAIPKSCRLPPVSKIFVRRFIPDYAEVTAPLVD